MLTAYDSYITSSSYPKGQTGYASFEVSLISSSRARPMAMDTLTFVNMFIPNGNSVHVRFMKISFDEI